VDLYGASVSSDGRLLTFIDWDTGDLAVREISSGEMTRVTNDGAWEPYECADEAMISPDGEWIAYMWVPPSGENQYELRLVRVGDPDSRLVIDTEDCHSPWPTFWYPDGERFLGVGATEDGTPCQIAVSVLDGSVHPVTGLGGLSNQVEGGRRAAFSPDRQFFVFDAPQEGDSWERDIFLKSVEGGEKRPLVRHPSNDLVLGWSPDGGHILFASERTGALGAWLLPVEGGRPTGDPTLVKPDLWRMVPIGFAQDGSFFYGVPMPSHKVYVAGVDPETGEVLEPVFAVSGDPLAQEQMPAWSQDGRFLAFRSGSTGNPWTRMFEEDRTTISIRSLETGETRQLSPDLEGFGQVRWYPGNHHLLVHGRDRQGRGGLHKVDVQTGEAEHLVSDLQAVRLIDWDPEEMKVFYRRSGGGIAVVDLETGQKNVLYGVGVTRWPALSPDGRHLAFGAVEGDTPSLMVMSSTGGAPRAIARFQAEEPYSRQLFVRGITWSPDSQYVIYAGGAEEGIWRVPAAGGPREKLESLTENIQGTGGHIQELHLRPDGRRIAFDVRKGGAEVWVMEDFLAVSGEKDRSP
jgi:Tol biopolymer transport system component